MYFLENKLAWSTSSDKHVKQNLLVKSNKYFIRTEYRTKWLNPPLTTACNVCVVVVFFKWYVTQNSGTICFFGLCQCWKIRSSRDRFSHQRRCSIEVAAGLHAAHFCGINSLVFLLFIFLLINPSHNFDFIFYEASWRHNFIQLN